MTISYPKNATIIGRNLRKQFGQRILWDSFDFLIESGQMVALTGPSGSGKTTLLNCIGLLEPVTAGDILVDGSNITKFHSNAARRFRRDSLGYLFQDYALVENISIVDNLKVATAAQPRSIRAIAPKAGEALGLVGLGGRENEPIYQLSGGEQQRVALARLIVKNPSVVLADEPTGALDHGNADMVIKSLRSMADSGCAVLIATHSEHVARACDRRIELGLSSTVK